MSRHWLRSLFRSAPVSPARRPRLRPQLLQLEDRDVPATFYVDPTFTNDGDAVDGDKGRTGNQPATVGTDAFDTIAEATAAAADGDTIIVNLGTYPEAVVLTGTETLDLTGPNLPGTVVINSLDGPSTAAVTLSDSSLTVGNATSTSFAGVISGTGGLTKVGTGTFTLTGANTYTGATAVNAGTLAAANAAALGGTAGGTTVAAGATLDVRANIGTEAVSLAGSLVTSTGIGTVGGPVGLTAAAAVGGPGDLTISGNISGAFGLTKSGTGTTTLSGANTYTGTTAVNAGTLAAAGGAAIPDAGAVNLTAGTFRLNASETIGSLTGVAGTAVNLQANGLTVGDATSTPFAGVISGTGTLTKQGAGTLTLSGANTYAGQTTVSGGTLVAANAAALGSNANGTIVGAGATLDVRADIGTESVSLGLASALVTGAGTGTVGGPVGLSANATIGGDGDLTIAGAIGGLFDLEKVGAGTTTLSGANNFTGLTVSAGTLVATSADALGTAFAGTAVAAGATLDVRANVGLEEITDLAGSLITGSGTGAVGGDISLTADAVVGGAGNLTLGGVISGGFGLTKAGAGTLTLSASNTYTGPTAVNAGTLLLTATGAVTSDVTVTSPGTLAGSGFINGSVGGDGTIAPGNAGPGLLTIVGDFAPAGTIELDAATPYGAANIDRIAVTGGVDLSAATLDFSGAAGGAATPSQLIAFITNDAADSTIPSADPTEGATVTLGATAFRIFYNGGDGNDVVLVEASAPAVVYVDGGFVANAGQIITDADQGTDLDQPAVFGVSAFLTIGEALAAVASGGAVVVNSGTYTEDVTLAGVVTLRVGGPDVAGAVVIGDLAGPAGTAVDLSGVSSLTVGDDTDTTFTGGIVGGGSLTKAGTATFTLAGVNAYTGPTIVSAGTLVAANAAALGTDDAGTAVTAGATLDVRANIGTEAVLLTGSLVTGAGTGTVGGVVTLTANTAQLGGAGDLTVAGEIAGPFGLTKTGTGTTTLGGTNTYSGTTTAADGTLLVNGSVGGGATVNAGTLGGTGTIGGTLTVNAGGTVNPGLGGNTVGTLTVGGLTFNGGTYRADFNANTSDTISSAGAIDLNGGTAGVFFINSQTGMANPAVAFTLIQNTGTNPIVDPPLTGAAEGATATIAGADGIFTYAAANGQSFGFVASVAPEFVLPAAGTYILRVVPVNNVPTLQLLQGATVLFALPLAAVLDPVTVTGTAGADTLIIDYTAAGGFFDRDVIFNADGGFDTLRIQGGLTVGGPFGRIEYDYLNATDGTIENFADRAGTVLINTITYTGLSPLVNTGTAEDIVFNLPAGPSAALLADDGTDGNGLSRLSSVPATFEQTDFANPTNSLTINSVNAADTLAVNALPDFTAGLTVGAVGAAFASINLTAPLSLTTGAGNLALFAGTIDLNGAATITTANAQTYTGPVRVLTDAALTSTGDRAVTFSTTVDGAGGLTVTTAGNTTFGGAVGAGTALASLTTDAAGTTFVNGPSVRTAGGQSFGDAVVVAGPATQFQSTGAGAVAFGSTLDGPSAVSVLTGGVTTFGGAVGGTNRPLSLATDSAGGTTVGTAGAGGLVRTTGAQSFGDAVTVAGATAVFDSNAGGDITFSSTLDGAAVVAVNTGGTTTFVGLVGADTPLAHLSTDTPGTSVVSGLQRTTGGQSYGDPVTVTTGTVFESTGGGPIEFNSTLDGGAAVTVRTAGATTFGGAVGGTTPLASLVTDGTGRVFVRGGGAATTGGQSYGGPVTVQLRDAVFAAGGAVTFTSTLNGAFNVTVTTPAVTTFGGRVGATTALTSLRVNGGGAAAVNADLVQTTGDQLYAGPVTVGVGTRFAATAAGAITFATTLDGAFDVVVDTTGATTFGGSVGGTTPLASLTTIAGGTTAVNGPVVRTTGGQTYADPVAVAGPATLFESTGDAAIAFAGTLDGPSAVTVTTGGATTFAGAVGGTTALLSLTTNGGGTTAVNGTGVTTTGQQAYGDPVAVAGPVTGFTSTGVAAAGNITFGGTLTGPSDVTVTTAGDTTFGGAVTVNSLTTDGAATGTTRVNGGSVSTTGQQTYGDPVAVGANTTFASSGLAAAGNITFAQTLTGAFDVIVNTAGATTFGGAVTVGSLATNAGGATAVNGGSVSTTGQQTYGDPVAVGANTDFVSSGAGTAGNITFQQTLNGGFQVRVNTAGTTAFNGSVGGANPLASLATDAPGTTAVNGGLVRTTGGQTYGDPVSVAGPATLFESSNAGAIAFGQTLNGDSNVTVNTDGATTFGGAVGGTTALRSLATNAGGTTAVNGGTVTTTGEQTYGDPVAVGADTAFGSTGAGAAGNIAFQQTLDGGFAVTVNTAGTTTFGGAVGAGTALASLATNAGGTTAVNGGGVMTTGGQTYGDDVTVGQNATFISTGSGVIAFLGNLDGAFVIAVTTAGLTRFGDANADAVGGVNAPTQVNFDGAGSIRIDAGRFRVSGPQTFNEPLSVGPDATAVVQVESTGNGAVRFTSSVEGPAGLGVTTDGLTAFEGTVGLATALARLDTDVGGTTDANGGTIRTTGGQTYGDAVVLTIDSTFTSVAGGAINFVSTLDGEVGDGAFAAAVNTAGLTTFGREVGGTTRLRALTTDADGTTAVNGGLVQTTGDQTFNDPVRMGAPTTYRTTGGGVAFGQTLTGTNGSGVAFDTAGAGDVRFFGSVGAGAGSAPAIGDLTVGSARDVLASAGVTAGGAVRVTATRDLVVFLGLAAGGEVRATAEDVTVTGGLTAGGAFTASATQDVSVSGFASAVGEVRVTARNLTVTGPLTAGGAVTATTTQDVMVTGGTTAGAEVRVINARNVTFGGDVTAATFFRQDAGAGTTTLAGGKLTALTGDVVITTDGIVLRSGVVAADQLVYLNPQTNGVDQSPAGDGVQAKHVRLGGAGTFSLENPNNDAGGTPGPENPNGDAGGFFRARVNGAVAFRDKDDLTIDPSADGGVSTGGGALTLYAGGDFTAQAAAGRFLVDAGAVLIVPGTAGQGSRFVIDADIRAASAQFGNRTGSLVSNRGADAFSVRPSSNIGRNTATTEDDEIRVFGNAPPVQPGTKLDPGQPGDSILPITTGPTVANVRFTRTGTDGVSISGFYTITFNDGSPPATIRFEEIESFEDLGFRAAVVQTGDRNYAIRAQRVQTRQDGAGVRGQAIQATPFVVSPDRVNPSFPFAAPQLAFGDVDGVDGTDLIVVNGTNDAPLVTIISGSKLFGGQPLNLQDLTPETGLLAQFYAFEDPNLRTGLSVAAADFDGDGKAEVVIGAGNTGGPRVSVYTFVAGRGAFNNMVPARTESATGRGDGLPAGQRLPVPPGRGNFFALNDPNFRGGVNVAAGDVTGDGTPDLVIGAGPGGGPVVEVIDGKSGVAKNFLAYGSTLRGGVLVAVGEFDGAVGADSKRHADILTGPGYGGSPHIKVFSGEDDRRVLASFFAFAPTDSGLGTLGAGVTGVGGVAFGAANAVSATAGPSVVSGGQEVLVSSARGGRLQVKRFTFKADNGPVPFVPREGIDPKTDAMTGRVTPLTAPTKDADKLPDFFTELTLETLPDGMPRPGASKIEDPVTDQVLTADQLFDGGTVAGFAVPPNKG